MEPAVVALLTVVVVLVVGIIVGVGTAAVVGYPEDSVPLDGIPLMETLVELNIRTFVDATSQGDFDMAEMAAGSALRAGRDPHSS